MGRRLRSGGLLVGGLGLLLLAAPLRAEDPLEAASAEELVRQLGHADFLRHCAPCHGRSARGDGPAASSLKVPPADLTRIAARHGGRFPAREVSEYIDGRRDVVAHGSRAMPVWGRTFARRIHEEAGPEEVLRGRLMTLVEYLRSIQSEE